MQVNHALDFFNEIFLSTNMWGYLGPVGWLFLCFIVVEKRPNYGVLMYVITLIVTFGTYMTNALFLDHIWKALILVFGGMFVCLEKQFR